MKKILVFLLLLTGELNAQQIPWTIQEGPTLVNSGTSVAAAPYEFHTPYLTQGPILFTQNSQNDITAGQRIQLGPGFRAGDFSNSNNYNPYFHAQIGTQPDFEVVYIEPNSNYPQVGQFEKLEMGIRLPSSLEQQVNAFLNGQLTGILNPFDPEQISVEAVFSNGVHSYTVYGFYYDEFERDPAAMTVYAPANWIAQPTNYHWRVRFAPPFTGAWNCSVSIRLAASATYSYSVNNISFNCVPSNNPGFLKVGNDNRHLAFSGTGESFFALGQNIAWNDGIYFRGESPITNPRAYYGGFLDVLDWVENLADNGGNMVRVCTIGWSFELEPYQLNNYSERMNHEWELDRLFELCEQKHVMISFSFADRRFKSSSGQSNPLMNWENNPYHTQLSGIDYPNDFLTDAIALDIFSKKIRYFMARYSYSTSLGIFAPIGEINGGYSESYPNDELKMYSWFNSILSMTKGLVRYRPILLSTSYGDHREIGNPTPFDLVNCDITTVHSYHAERSFMLTMNDELNKSFGSDRGTLHRWDNKPSYIEEMGICPDDGCGADPNDFEGCSDITYHNSLWSTAFMGGFGAGFVWWQWFNNDYRVANYPALHAFFDDVDFQNVNFNDPDFWDDNYNNNHSLSTLETFYIRSDDRNRVMGWVHNSTYWWGNIDQYCEDRNQNLMNIPNDDDPVSTPADPIIQKFEIGGLNNLSSYEFVWYSTRSNGGISQTLNIQSDIFGKIHPNWIGGEDHAFKAYRPGNNFRINSEITYDTIQCDEDTIQVYGNHEMDTLKNFSYYWDFGNGQNSNSRNTTVVYSIPGTYLVTLVVSDTLGWSDTMKQYIIKPAPCIAGRASLSYSDQNENTDFYVSPNPAIDQFNLKLDSTWADNVIVNLYSLEGRLVLRKIISYENESSLPIADLNSGIYFLIVTDEKHSSVKKVIVLH